MRRWFAASLLLFSCAVFAIPDNPAAEIPDFFDTIAEFVGHVNSRIYGWLEGRVMEYMYGDYQKLLEYDLGGINAGVAGSFLLYPVDRSDYFQRYAAASVDSMQAAYSEARLAAAQKQKCIGLYEKRQSCKDDCPTAYSIKTCTDVFFGHLNSATGKLNESFDYAMRQISADYYTYGYYGIGENAQNALFGCYLSVVDIYNDFYAFRAGGEAHAEKVREERDIGDRIVVAFGSLGAGPESYGRFFNTLGGGRDSVVFQLLNQHQECSRIEKKALEDFSAASADFIAKLEDRQAEFERIKAGGFCGLGQDDIDAILDEAGSEARALSMQVSADDDPKGTNPAQSCGLIEGSISKLSALKKRMRAEENANRFFLRISQEIGGSEKTFKNIDGNLANIMAQSDGIAEKARERAESLKKQAVVLRGEIPDSGAKPVLLSEFDAMLEKAESAISEAGMDGTEGGRARKYSVAIRRLLEVQEAFGQKEGSDDAGGLLSRAEELYQLAAADGVDVSREKAFIRDARFQLSAGRKFAAAAMARAAAAGILEKAGARYSGLGSQRERILSELSFLSGAGAAVDASNFDHYEKFFSGGELDVRMALGSLKKMGGDYGQIEEQLSGRILSNQSSLLSGMLSRTQPEVPGDVVVGEPAQVYLSFSFSNQLPFSLDPKTIELPLVYPPSGRISGKDVLSAHSAAAAQEGDRLVLLVGEIKPKEGFGLDLAYGSIVAKGGSVNITEAHTQRAARWAFSARTAAPPGIKRLLLPVPDNRYLLEFFPGDFRVLGGRQYLVVWHPAGDYRREFSVPSGLLVERKVEGAEALQNPMVRVSERVSVRNGLGILLRSVKIELPLYLHVAEPDAQAGRIEGSNLVLTVDLSPNELREIAINYTVSDPKFYSEVLLSEADTRLSMVSSRADAANLSAEIGLLRARRESGNRLYMDGNYGGAISELVPLWSEAEKLEGIADGGSAAREAFIRLNSSFSEKMSGLKSVNSIYLLLGMNGSSKDTRPLEYAQSLAGREFLRGNAAVASELLVNSSFPSVDESALLKALGARKQEAAGGLDDLTRLRMALAAIGKNDGAFNAQIENASFAYNEFSRAVSARDYPHVLDAAGYLYGAMRAARESGEQLVSAADGRVVSFLADRSGEIGAAQAELASFDYDNALSLHLPPAVGGWARENGITDESGGLAKTAAGLQAELGEEEHAIRAAMNMSPVSRILFLGSKNVFSSDPAGRVREFSASVRSLLDAKERDAASGLERSEAMLEGGRLDGAAGLFLSSASRAKAAGRFQDSLAYTSYAVATFSRDPPKTPYYAASAAVLLVVAIAYRNRKRVSGKPGGAPDIDAAERRISLRKTA